MKEPRFNIEKGISEKKVNSIESQIANIEKYSSNYLNNVEIKKTPEQIKIISLLNSYLKEEQSNLGLEVINEVDNTKIYFLKNRDFSIFNKEKSIAHSNVVTKDILISEDGFKNINRLKFIEILLHEMSHIVSHSTLILRKDFNLQSSSGFRKSSIGGDQHFFAFNEFATQAVTINILRKKMGEIASELNLSKEELDEYKKLPEGYRNTFNLFINIISQKIMEDKKIDNKDFILNLKKNYFKGSIYFLRQVEDIWGVGSLRVLASLGSQLHKAVHGDRLDTSLHEKYFSANSEEERDKYMKQIFGFEDKE